MLNVFQQISLQTDNLDYISGLEVGRCCGFYYILGLNFIFLLFLGMAMYDNEFETTENKI